MCYPRNEVMHHLATNNNLAITIGRQGQVVGSMAWNLVFCTKNIQDFNCFYRGGGVSFPVYLYSGNLVRSRDVNFSQPIYTKLKILTKHPEHGEPDEVAVFDYIYGVLHCPAYRETYAEFLKIDFPRIPWPTSPDEFWDVSDKGGQLRKLHLMEPAAIGATPYPLKGEGNSVIDKIRFEDGKIWINATQYFEGAPPVSWDFYIGGYQPAQKWLKDRKGRTLSFDDVKHYQKTLKILDETDRVMGTIQMTLN